MATATRVGLSEPISTGGPSESDVSKTRDLEKVGYLHCSEYFVERICSFKPYISNQIPKNCNRWF